MKFPFLLLFCFFLAACFPPKPAKRPTAPTTIPSVPQPPPPAPPPVPEPSMPERNASNDLLVRGNQRLEAKDYSSANRLFHDSITLDPTNGPAYYYLALSHYLSGDVGEVLDLLDEAQALLTGKKEWLEAIDQLRKDAVAVSPP